MSHGRAQAELQEQSLAGARQTLEHHATVVLTRSSLPTSPLSCSAYFPCLNCNCSAFAELQQLWGHHLAPTLPADPTPLPLTQAQHVSSHAQQEEYCTAVKNDDRVISHLPGWLESKGQIISAGKNVEESEASGAAGGGVKRCRGLGRIKQLLM